MCLICKTGDVKCQPYRKCLKQRVAKVTKETEQKILDFLHQSKTIGEACKEFALETDVMCEIINRNIVTNAYLSKQVL